MRTEAIRRINTKPMKSPSPDIANRSMIKDTKIPIDDIKRYLQKSGKSRSPRATNSASLIVENGRQNSIQNLLQKINALENVNRQLQIENTHLRQKINILLHEKQRQRMQPINSQIGQVIQSEYTSRYNSPKSIDQNEEKFRQLQERLMKLLNQNGRLGNIIYEKDNQIKRLMDQNRNIPANTRDQSRSFPLPSSLEDKNSIKSIYESQILPEMKRSQLIWINRIRELNDKVQKLQQQQRYIQNYKVPNYGATTPDKYFKREKNTIGSDRNQTNEPEQLTVRQFDTSRSQPSNRQYSNFIDNLKNQIEQLRNRCSFLEEQLRNERQKKKGGQSFAVTDHNFDVNNGNKSMMGRSVVSNRSRQRERAQTENILNDKIHQLESQLQKRILKIADLQRQLAYQKDSQKDKQQNNLNLFQKQKNKLKSLLDQQRKKNIDLEEKLEKLQQQVALNQEQDLQKINKMNENEAAMEGRLQQIRNQYENKLNLKNMEIAKYLELIKKIRADVESYGLELQCQADPDVIKKYSQLQQTNITSIHNLKQQLIIKEQQILQLQKQVNILSEQVHQLQQQKLKLKELLADTNNFSHTLSENMNLEKEQQNCKLRLCLKETMSKIDMLENQILHILDV